MTSITPARKTTPDRAAFCERLRQRRIERDLSLDDIASETRIPVRSLESLEKGQFESLPADVFVRGFLRSYARCVGLDADDTVRRYARLGFVAAPVASEMAIEVLAQLREDDSEAQKPSNRVKRRLARGSSHGETPASAADTGFRAGEWLAKVKARATETRERHHAPKKAPVRKAHTSERAKADTSQSSPRIFLPRDFSSSANEEGRRGNLTFAVIVLVIVATITMSYLMRRPSHSGDGISLLPAAEHVERG